MASLEHFVAKKNPSTIKTQASIRGPVCRLESSSDETALAAITLRHGAAESDKAFARAPLSRSWTTPSILVL
jgi:hypothetical protein